MPIDATKASRLLEKKLSDLRRKTVVPGSMLDLVEATARAQLAARSGENVVLAPESLEDVERNLRGAPLLPRHAFPVDMARATALFEELTRVVLANEAHLAESMATITADLASGKLRLEDALARYPAGDETFFAAYGEHTPNAPRLLNFLVQAALTPGLAAVGEAAYAHFPEERTWNFGHCPVCGSPPLMARLLGKGGARHLTCSFCQLEYRAKRLMCPYCGEEDHAKLEVFTSPGEPGYAVNVCLTCRTYIKTTDFREMDRPSLPVLDDLESLTLDLAARGQGYTRPVLSAWGF